MHITYKRRLRTDLFPRVGMAGRRMCSFRYEWCVVSVKEHFANVQKKVFILRYDLTQMFNKCLNIFQYISSNIVLRLLNIYYKNSCRVLRQ